MKRKRKKKRESMMIKKGSKKAKSRREGKEDEEEIERRMDITWGREGEPGTCRFTQSSGVSSVGKGLIFLIKNICGKGEGERDVTEID